MRLAKISGRMFEFYILPSPGKNKPGLTPFIVGLENAQLLSILFLYKRRLHALLLLSIFYFAVPEITSVALWTYEKKFNVVS